MRMAQPNFCFNAARFFFSEASSDPAGDHHLQSKCDEKMSKSAITNGAAVSGRTSSSSTRAHDDSARKYAVDTKQDFGANKLFTIDDTGKEQQMYLTPEVATNTTTSVTSRQRINNNGGTVYQWSNADYLRVDGVPAEKFQSYTLYRDNKSFNWRSSDGDIHTHTAPGSRSHSNNAPVDSSLPSNGAASSVVQPLFYITPVNNVFASRGPGNDVTMATTFSQPSVLYGTVLPPARRSVRF